MFEYGENSLSCNSEETKPAANKGSSAGEVEN